MSQAVNRVPLKEAEAIAEDLVELLEPCCERIEVAGSIRRRLLAIGDIDLVAVARSEPGAADLFGEPAGAIDMLDARCDELRADGVLQPRFNAKGFESWGPRSKRAVFRGLSVDINAVADASTFGFWLLIRTGPPGFSHAMVTPRSQKAAIRRRDGSVREYRTGLLPPGFEVKQGFRLYRHGGPVETLTEESVFDALGLIYVKPEDRR